MPARARPPAEAKPLRLGYRLEFAIFRAVFAFFATLPRGVALRLGAWLGELFYLLDVNDRRVGLLNLRRAFPEKTDSERRRILRTSCRNLGRTAAEFCHLPQLDVQQLSSVISFSDHALWQQMMERAKVGGGIVLTGHFGNWELLAYAQGLLGYPITLVHRPMHNLRFDAAIAEIRGRAGTRALSKKSAAKEALRTIKQKGILVIPSDQNQTRSAGVFVDFFGTPACTSPGAARLGMLTGAPVVPAFLVRQGESAQHRFEVLPEVEMISTGDRDADIITNTQRCTAVIEDMIRRYPEQWIWFHKRWKTRPLGTPQIY